MWPTQEIPVGQAAAARTSAAVDRAPGESPELATEQRGVGLSGPTSRRPSCSWPRRLVPSMRASLSSTNVFVHVETTPAGAGIGFLPCFIGDQQPDLVRLLPEQFQELLQYWMVLRQESLHQPAVAAVVAALRAGTSAFTESLLGAASTR
ncbi:hypothetical protein E3T28_14860 [Cryobacterium sinapicolor]|uniref:LysR substrate-binding domain-containing protein n=1 Tax=Cryobacterium sinapicolor TaxID=1259236 RepID=A0ABY2ITM1_9MICO|nr:LysR substrate-binding domain-containing protein [Cryobacterium sinapicolor]TFC94580.1 hypothetical protein E3T28_14860 [Cryobacterium sinapicolor]